MTISPLTYGRWGCVACGGAGYPLCRNCEAALAARPPRRLHCGLVVHSALEHEGTARLLVHRLKYQGLVHASRVLAGLMACLVPPQTEVLVPVPRARVRRWRYGVDPAYELVVALSRLTSIPAERALRPQWWWAPHAGGGRAVRRSPHFVLRRRVDRPSVLVDDVLTTGATLSAAAAVVGSSVIGGLTATSAVYS